MKRWILSIAMIVSLFAAAFAQHVAHIDMGDGTGHPEQGHIATMLAKADTEVWVFQTPWLSSSSSAAYPADVDSIISNPFRYCTVYRDDSTNVYYNSNKAVCWSIYDETYLYNKGVLYFYWPLYYLPYEGEVTEAYLCLKSAFWDNRATNNTHVAIDTIMASTFVAANTIYNSNYTNATYQYADSANTIRWVPGQIWRDELDDFGQNFSIDTIDTLAPGQWLYMDITEAVDTLAARNYPPALLSPFFVASPGNPYEFHCGPSAAAADQPFLVVKFVRKTARPWQGKQLAFVWMFDDLWREDQMALLDTLETLGLKCSLVGATRAVGLGPGYFSASQIDSLYKAGHNIVYHSCWHAAPYGWDPVSSPYGLMRYVGCDTLAMESAPDSFYAKTGVPVSALDYFALPSHYFTDSVIDTLVAYGFKGVRTGPKGTDTSKWSNPHNTPCGGQPSGYILAPPVWNGESNIYHCAIYCELDKIVGKDTESPGREVIEARVDSIISDALARGDYPAVILYTHDSKTHTGWPGGVEQDEFGWMIRRFAASPYIKWMKFDEMMDWYRSHHHPVPGTGGLVWR